jgi:enoyl-CoA hydratase/carnithine racemase
LIDPTLPPMSAHIRTDLRERVLHITIDRPEKKNALTVEMYEALIDALQRAAEPDVRVILLSGTGGTFCAGNDLGDFLRNPPQDTSAPVYRFLESLSTFEKPIIAAVAGVAVGIGTTILLHCDLVLAAPSARFSLPFVDLGLCPEAASSYLLPLTAGRLKAGEWLLFGDPFGAGDALEAGLINRIVPEEELLETAFERAASLGRKPPQSVLLTKRLLRHAHREQIERMLRLEASLVLERLQSEEVAEAVQAFFEKREPDFSRFD